MRSKTVLGALLICAMTVSVIGCGVPKGEHEKIVKKLEQANQEKTALTDQLDKLRKEKDSLSQQVAKLETQINTLQQENQAMKAKGAPKAAPKPAPAKPASKAPPKKKK